MRIKPSTSLTALLAMALLAFMAVGCQPSDEGATGGDDGATTGTTGDMGTGEEDMNTSPDGEMEGASSEGATEMQWAATFDEAVSKAKEQDKMVFIKFTADWCAPCHAMEDEALSDKVIIGDLQKISVPVHVDIEDPANKEVVEKYLFDPAMGANRGIPYAVMLDGDGKVVSDMVGYGGKDSFHAWVSKSATS